MRDAEGQSERLFVGAPEAVIVSGHFEFGDGWKVTVSIRRQFQLWPEASAGEYDHLTSEELVDVLSSVLAVELLG